MSLDFDVTPWQNWAGNLSVTPVAHCKPKSLSDLVGFVQQAEQNGNRVRAVGSSWSFSDIAMTTDYVVETNLLNQVVNTVNPEP
jgi:FAD/FMN-containing dehydrogenase